MSTLHTINKNQDHTKLFDDLKLAITHDDSVLLIEDGCYALSDDTLIAQLSSMCGSPVLALLNDTKARGLVHALANTPDNNDPAAKAHHTAQARGISYQEFVQQSLAHDKAISWF